MSRDSLTHGTTNNQLLRSSHNRRGHHMPASQIAGIAQDTAMEADLKAKMASITIQRWYRKIQMRRKAAEAALKRLVESEIKSNDICFSRVLEQKKVEYQASIERTKELEKLSLLEQKKTREDKQRQARLTGLKVIFFLFLHILRLNSLGSSTTSKTTVRKSSNNR